MTSWPCARQPQPNLIIDASRPSCFQAGYGFAAGYRSAIYGMAMGQVWAGYWLAIDWLLPGYVPISIHFHTQSYTTIYAKMAHGCYQYFGLQCVHKICWLLAGYWLAMSQKQYNSRHSHILLPTKVVQGCNQYFGLQCIHKSYGCVAQTGKLGNLISRHLLDK